MKQLSEAHLLAEPTRQSGNEKGSAHELRTSGDPVGGSPGFDVLYDRVEAPLRRSLTAHYGHERGREAFAEAMAYAWENTDRLQKMENPTAYLFRVGQSRTRTRRRRFETRSPDSGEPSDFEPGLTSGLAQLTRRQRTCVVLSVGYQWSHAEIAELLHISKPSVQKHAERGLSKLRNAIGGVEP